jgi:hypothetical protein
MTVRTIQTTIDFPRMNRSQQSTDTTTTTNTRKRKKIILTDSEPDTDPVSANDSTDDISYHQKQKMNDPTNDEEFETNISTITKKRKNRIIISGSDTDTDPNTTDDPTIRTGNRQRQETVRQTNSRRKEKKKTRQTTLQSITNIHNPHQPITTHDHTNDHDTDYQSLTNQRPLDTIIPHLTTSSYNMGTLSAYPLDKEGRSRQLRALEQIETLTKSSEITFIQETRLNLLRTYNLLHARFPTHKIYYNNPTDNKGGTLIMLSPRVRHY